jgi:predicted AlkP superfamily phosphohydrolase/phosphomutase
MDPGRIYLNAATRFRNGILSPGSAQEVRAQLKSRLERLRPADVGIYDDTSGEPIFSEVLVKEQVYTGQSVHLAPDLVVIPTRGYDVKATVSVSAAAMKDIFTGMHTHDDAFLMVNDSSIATRLAKPHITDVAALIEEGLL